ncbi:MAG TPA: hypothetical protein VLZ51_10975, partial [Brevundimonas sp.]|nr:hypothetical protein [Brevundimonas sp.]
DVKGGDMAQVSPLANLDEEAFVLPASDLVKDLFGPQVLPALDEALVLPGLAELKDDAGPLILPPLIDGGADFGDHGGRSALRFDTLHEHLSPQDIWA